MSRVLPNSDPSSSGEAMLQFRRTRHGASTLLGKHARRNNARAPKLWTERKRKNAHQPKRRANHRSWQGVTSEKGKKRLEKERDVSRDTRSLVRQSSHRKRNSRNRIIPQPHRSTATSISNPYPHAVAPADASVSGDYRSAPTRKCIDLPTHQ